MARRVAVVTGANKGLGFGDVRVLCQKFDGDVFLTSRNEELGRKAVAELEKEGLHPKYFLVDILKEEHLTRLRDYLKENYGGLDLLINNAGIAYKMKSDVPFAEQVEVTMRTNFFANLNACKILFPILRPHARVTNMASSMCQVALAKCSPEMQRTLTNDDITMDELVGLMNKFVETAQKGEHVKAGFADYGYGMAKIGVTVMSKIFQRELDEQGADDIVVNACCGGYVATDMTGHVGIPISEGIVTPLYCALLPPNIKSPRGKFIREEKIADFCPSS